MSLFDTTSTDLSTTTTSRPSSGFKFYKFYAQNKSAGQQNIINGIVIIVGVQIGLLLLVAIIAFLRGRGSAEPDSTSDVESQTKHEHEEIKSQENSNHLNVAA